MSLSSPVRPPEPGEIRAAAQRLRDVVIRAPLLPLQGVEQGQDILLKLESLQPVGSFKIRGVFNAVLAMSPAARAQGLSTVSAGNTAQALAWTARRLGLSARSVMPDTAPATKIDSVRRWGGEPVLVPVDEVFRFLREHLWEDQPYAFVHPWTNRDVMIGHGTMGLEIAAEVSGVDSVFIPVGGGGLIGGVGSALKAAHPDVRVVAVEPEGCPALHESLRGGCPATVECRTMCDGVAVPYITGEMFPLLRDIVDRVVLVPEAAVRDTIRRLALRDGIVAEPSAALSVAAAVKTPFGERGRSVAVVTGRSIDPATLVEILGESPAGP